MLNGARRHARSQDLIAVLDLGSSKVCCVIAHRPPPPPGVAGPAPLRVVGIGHQRSRGVKAGMIFDLDEAEAAIRTAVSQAERMAGVEVDRVVVSVACGRLKSSTFTARAEVPHGIVGDDEISRVLAGGRAYAERDGRTLIHLTQIGYRLDGAAGVRDPRGMAARVVTGDLHAVTADEAPVRNLLHVIERCHLGVGGFVANPYAAGLAVTTAEERRLGVTVVDIGGGTATIAMFAEEHFVHADVLPVGSNHITFDIASALSTPLAEAERIKALYGTMVRARSDEHEVVSYPVAGDDESGVRHTTKAELHEILRPRVEGMLSLMRDRIQGAPLAGYSGGRIVLTGGGSQLVGLGAAAAEILGCPVRVARPSPVGGLPPNVCSPAFAVVVGLLQVAASGSVSVEVASERDTAHGGYLSRVGTWLKEF